jgi:hypothetical protein
MGVDDKGPEGPIGGSFEATRKWVVPQPREPMSAMDIQAGRTDLRFKRNIGAAQPRKTGAYREIVPPIAG